MKKPTREERTQLERICRVPGCNNESANGLVECIAHVHGVSRRAAPDLIALKKKFKEWIEDQAL